MYHAFITSIFKFGFRIDLGRKVALASEAKAALQVTEDYSKVKLKKVKEPGKLICEGDENGGVKQSSISNVLLKIKGNTHIAMRSRFLKL